ncbi:MAG: MaoC/PaaZ C-terminal domain-containing protein [Dehalococcoidia bacterium]|nr:MaoC/PaaZ C-terminal domain-containing protein [Dehalococcoidia bacterium]
MNLEYYEDISLAQKWKSRAYPLSQKEMVEFATVWEPRAYHVDPEFARNTKFGGLIATGNHLISIAYRLVYEMSCEKTPPTAFIVGLGLDEIRFLVPARPGDILVLEREVISMRESKSNPEAGIVTYANRLLNQKEERVFTMNSSCLVERRRNR